MDNIIVSGVFVALILSVWILPAVYPVAATMVIAGLTVYAGYLSVSSWIVLMVLAITGYQLLQHDGKRSILLRINVLLIVFWALWSEDFQAAMISWTNYFQLLSAKYPIVIQVTFEKYFCAVLLAAYVLKPRININYWRGGVAGTWEVLLLLYIVLLLPLAIILHVFSGLRIGNQNLLQLVMSLIIICFTEEILYRLILQNWCYRILRNYSRSLASWLAIALVSTGYALFHIELGPSLVIIYFFIGSAYGYVYQKSGKIEVAILVHFAVRLTFSLILAFYAHNHTVMHPLLIN